MLFIPLRKIAHLEHFGASESLLVSLSYGHGLLDVCFKSLTLLDSLLFCGGIGTIPVKRLVHDCVIWLGFAD